MPAVPFLSTLALRRKERMIAKRTPSLSCPGISHVTYTSPHLSQSPSPSHTHSTHLLLHVYYGEGNVGEGGGGYGVLLGVFPPPPTIKTPKHLPFHPPSSTPHTFPIILSTPKPSSFSTNHLPPSTHSLTGRHHNLPQTAFPFTKKLSTYHSPTSTHSLYVPTPVTTYPNFLCTIITLYIQHHLAYHCFPFSGVNRYLPSTH